MMDLLERLFYFALGGAIGFIVGYFVRELRTIEMKVDDVNDNIRKKDDSGVFTHRWSANLALFVVVAVTLYAALMSQAATNEANKTTAKVVAVQKDQNQILNCTTQVLFDSIETLSQRGTYVVAQGESTIRLQRRQLEFLSSFLSEPPPTGKQTLAAFKLYVSRVEDFLELAKATKDKQVSNPLPTVDDFRECLEGTEAILEPMETRKEIKDDE